MEIARTPVNGCISCQTGKLGTHKPQAKNARDADAIRLQGTSKNFGKLLSLAANFVRNANTNNPGETRKTNIQKMVHAICSCFGSSNVEQTKRNNEIASAGMKAANAVRASLTRAAGSGLGAARGCSLVRAWKSSAA